MTLAHTHLAHIFDEVVEALDVTDVREGNRYGRKDIKEEFFSLWTTLSPHIGPLDIRLDDVVTRLSTAFAVQKDEHHLS